MSLLIAANVFLMIYKCWAAHPIMSKGENIYEQQVQSAKFLHQFYNTSKVVANDIGAISYYTNIHLLDIAGLGSVETIYFNENKKSLMRNLEALSVNIVWIINTILLLYMKAGCRGTFLLIGKRQLL